MAIYRTIVDLGVGRVSTTRQRVLAHRTTTVAQAGMAVTSCLVAFGLIILATADIMEDTGTSLRVLLFWLGLAFLFVPTALRLFGTQASRAQRVALVTQLGMALYLVKVFEYPLNLVLVDEGPHIRNTANIVATGHLFGAVPLVEIAAWFPGMEIVASALSVLTGLSPTICGMLVAGIARLLLVLMLYLFFEQVVRSPRVASVAVLVYMANPSFLFFDAQFAYETFGVALAALAFFAAAKYTGRGALARYLSASALASHSSARAARGTSRFAYLLIACGALMALAVTHHVTSYVAALFFVLWAGVAWGLALRRQRVCQSTRLPWEPTLLAVAAVAVNLLWVLVTKGQVVAYLAPFPEGIVKQMQVMAAGGSGRPLFQDGNGDIVPRWELLVSLGTVAIILSGLPAGLLAIWQRYRRYTLLVAVGLASLVYPLTLAMRLTPAGGLAGNRLTGYAYVPLALVLALAVTQPPRYLPNLPGMPALTRVSGELIARGRVALRPYVHMLTQQRLGPGLLAGLATMIFIGGVITGAPQAWKQLPGGYLVGADQRSVTPQGMDAVLWMNQFLSPNNRVATDIGNRELIIGYSNQQVANTFAAPLLPLFGSPTFGATQRYIIATDQIGYLLVDLRLSTGLPHAGAYFGDFQESGEDVPGLTPGMPLSPQALTKFNSVPHINRVFDNGTIVIYQTEIGTGGH